MVIANNICIPRLIAGFTYLSFIIVKLFNQIGLVFVMKGRKLNSGQDEACYSFKT